MKAEDTIRGKFIISYLWNKKEKKLLKFILPACIILMTIYKFDTLMEFHMFIWAKLYALAIGIGVCITYTILCMFPKIDIQEEQRRLNKKIILTTMKIGSWKAWANDDFVYSGQHKGFLRKIEKLKRKRTKLEQEMKFINL